jgi:hypothetical protein
MTDQPKTGSRSWWKYARFRVRTMIVVVLVVGGGLGWFVGRARVQRDAVRSIERKEGGVQYGWEFKNGENIAGEGRGHPNGWWIGSVSTTSVA